MDSEVIGSSWKLLLLLAAGTFLLLIACLNVANLLLARLMDRGKELCIRSALGARRERLAGQLFTESLILAIAARTVGVAVASAGTQALLAFLSRDASLPRLDTVRIDGGMLVFVCGLTAAISVIFGLIPSLRIPQGETL